MRRIARTASRSALAALASLALVSTDLDAAQPQQPPASTPVAEADDAQALLLEIVINGVNTGVVLRAQQHAAGGLLIEKRGWTSLGLVAPPGGVRLVDGTPALRLADLPQVRFRLDEQALVLHLDLGAPAFERRRFDLQRLDSPVPTAAASGVMLNYDASTQRSLASGTGDTGAVLEAVGFGPWGHLVHSSLLRSSGPATGLHRLDTYWRRDDPARLESLVIGDTVGDGGSWSNPVRYAGLRWARDFRLRPGYVTQPTLALSGESVLPATVDVWVNNVRQFSAGNPAGPFDIRNVPTLGGAGEVNLVVRDLLGRETVVRQTFYATPRLLAPGLSDFSVEAGALRRGWGTDSHYAQRFAAATWRHGFSASMTTELRAELQRERQAAGVDISTLLGHYALLRASLAGSRGSDFDAHEHGMLANVALERSSPTGGFTLQHRLATRGFAPLGENTALQPTAERVRRLTLAAAWLPIGRRTQAGISYVHQRRWDGPVRSTLALSASTPLSQRTTLALNLTRQVDERTQWVAAVSYTWLLDGRTLVGAGMDGGAGRAPRTYASADRSAPPGNGTGWRVEASNDQARTAAASVQHNGEHAIGTVQAASDREGRVWLRAGASGTVGLLGGHAFASRPVGNGSIVLVEAGGQAGVPVLRSQQQVATTDSQGRAVVPNVMPWVVNRIALDDTSLPMDVQAGELVQEIVPPSRGGAIVRFAIRRNRQALVLLRRTDGSEVPAGAIVTTLPQNEQHLVGLRGEAWITGLMQQGQLIGIEWDGGQCAATLPPLPEAEAAPIVGPVTCRQPP